MSKYKHILKENYKLADEHLDQAILVAPQIAQQIRPKYDLDNDYYQQFLADYDPHAEQYVSNADTKFSRGPSAQPQKAAATTSNEHSLFSVEGPWEFVNEKGSLPYYRNKITNQTLTTLPKFEEASDDSKVQDENFDPDASLEKLDTIIKSNIDSYSSKNRSLKQFLTTLLYIDDDEKIRIRLLRLKQVLNSGDYEEGQLLEIKRRIYNRLFPDEF
jgi:hypothetical protein